MKRKRPRRRLRGGRLRQYLPRTYPRSEPFFGTWDHPSDQWGGSSLDSALQRLRHLRRRLRQR